MTQEQLLIIVAEARAVWVDLIRRLDGTAGVQNFTVTVEVEEAVFDVCIAADESIVEMYDEDGNLLLRAPLRLIEQSERGIEAS